MPHSIDLNETVNLPLPPEMSEAHDMEIYARFMRHLRCVPTSRSEIKVLSAIQFTSDMLGCSDAHIARVLVDQGLRAPRAAFPADYLRFADQALMRCGWEVGGPSAAILELKEHWNAIGEDKFSSFKSGYDIVEAGALI